MRKALIVTAPALCTAILLTSSCSKSKAGGPGGPPPAPVKVAKAETRTLPVEIATIGNVEAFKTISVKSQVGGILIKVRFKEGDPIRSGQLLFEIDPRPYQETIRQIEANTARDQALLAQAEANLSRDIAQEKFYRDQAQRYDQLTKRGIVSKVQGEQAMSEADSRTEALRADRAAIDSAKSAIVADKSALDNAKLQLSYCYIYSPVDGRSGNISVKEGNLVKANDLELVTITQIQPVYVTFTVPERQLAAVRERMRSTRLVVRATPQGDTRPAEEGMLTFVDNAVDQNTGTIKLKGTFTNSSQRLWPGQFVSVALRLSEKPNVIALPTKAVQIGQGGNYVFIVKSDSTVEMRNVTTGDSNAGLVEVQGVQAGETVVTEGHIRLAPGSRVKVQS